jgi:putative transposase
MAMERQYETDLSDAQWELIRPLVEASVGRKATVERRRIVNAILYVARTGCQWRLLPKDFPNWSTVYSCYHRWTWNGTLDKVHTALRAQVRQAQGKKAQPTAAIVDSQSVKTVAKGGSRGCCNGAGMVPNGSVGASVL